MILKEGSGSCGVGFYVHLKKSSVTQPETCVNYLFLNTSLISIHSTKTRVAVFSLSGNVKDGCRFHASASSLHQMFKILITGTALTDDFQLKKNILERKR